jgi:hypothetical protein
MSSDIDLSVARPGHDYAAKPGRLYVVMIRGDAIRGFVGHPKPDWPHYEVVHESRHARKFSTVGDALCWLDGKHAPDPGYFNLLPFDDPHSVDVLLADQATRLRDRERIAWVAGEAKPEANGVAATNGVAS